MDGNEILENLAVQFGRIATALEGLRDEAKRAGNRYWAETRTPRDAVVTRVENEEDRAKKEQGASDKPIEDWLSELETPEIIGERTRQWLKEHPKENQTGNAGPAIHRSDEQDSASNQVAEDQSERPRKVSKDNPNNKRLRTRGTKKRS